MTRVTRVTRAEVALGALATLLKHRQLQHFAMSELTAPSTWHSFIPITANALQRVCSSLRCDELQTLKVGSLSTDLSLAPIRHLFSASLQRLTLNGVTLRDDVVACIHAIPALRYLKLSVAKRTRLQSLFDRPMQLDSLMLAGFVFDPVQFVAWGE